MVRESIFNIIGGVVEDRAVVDLFAGTGALGLEALSRGASSALFVERDRANVALIRKNIAHLRFEDRTRVIQGDAYRWMAAAQGFSTPVVVFVDAPYGDYQDRRNRMGASLGALVGGVPADSLVVLEMPERIEPGLLPEGDWDIRRYGSTRVGFLTKAAEPTEQSAGASLDDAINA